jgi:hypothetical protein
MQRLRRRRRHLPLVHRIEKLVPKLGVLGQCGEPHALARVADAIIVWGGSSAPPWPLVQAGARLVSRLPTPGSEPRSVMVELYSRVPRLSVRKTTRRGDIQRIRPLAGSNQATSVGPASTHHAIVNETGTKSTAASPHRCSITFNSSPYSIIHCIQ